VAVLAMFALFLAGLAWWSLLEYLLHRWAFHRFPRGFGARHMGHHARLYEKRLALAPLRTSIGGAVLHAVIFVGLLGTAGLAPLAGLLAGYLAYEVVHYRAHYVKPRSRWARRMRQHHMLHHHRDRDARFGVLTTFWDRVFGTLTPVHRAREVSPAAP
jgi:dihydroceramide fatty acyl 2-hydroxylase